jgi:hypothetical protein
MSNLVSGLFLPSGACVEPQHILVDGYKDIQKYVGGNFDCVSTNVGRDDVSFEGYVHDEGLLIGLEYNYLASALFGRDLVGDCVLLWGLSPDGERDGDNYDMPAEMVESITTELLEGVSIAYNASVVVSAIMELAIHSGMTTKSEASRIIHDLHEASVNGTDNSEPEAGLIAIMQKVADMPACPKDVREFIQDFAKRGDY